MAVVVSYCTESGDEGFVGVFNRKLTDDEWFGWVERNLPNEIEDGLCYAFRIEYEWNALIDDQPKPTENEIVSL